MPSPTSVAYSERLHVPLRWWVQATMLLATFALAILASVLAGMLPAWHACRVAPAVQLKSQ